MYYEIETSREVDHELQVFKISGLQDEGFDAQL